jgi:hypothetical protein
MPTTIVCNVDFPCQLSINTKLDSIDALDYEKYETDVGIQADKACNFSSMRDAIHSIIFVVSAALIGYIS